MRVIGWIIGIVLAVIIVAVVAVPMFFDPNDYKDQIATQVERQTGRKFDLDGDIGLSVFPWLAMELGHARLGNAEGFGDGPFAEIDGASVRVRLLPLLRREVEIDVVQLDGLKLNLVKAKSGRDNWSDLAGEKTTIQEKKSDSKGNAPERIEIGGIQVRNATVIWNDRQAGQRFAFSGFNLNTGAMDGHKPFDIEVNTVFEAPGMTGKLALDSTVSHSEDFSRLSAQGLKLRVDAQPSGKGSSPLTVSLDSDVSFENELQKIDLKNLTVALAGVLPDSDQPVSATGALSIDLMRERFSGKNIAVDIAGTRATVQVAGRNILGDAVQVDGLLSLGEFEPRELARHIGVTLPDTADKTVLAKAAANMVYEIRKDSAVLNGIKLQLDDTRLTGRVAVKNFARPAIDFGLVVDEIDLDRYLPEPVEQKGTSAPGKGAEAADVIPVEPLRALNLKGNLKIKKLKAFQIRSTDVGFVINAKDGALTISPARAQLYGGRYDGNIRINVRGSQPVVSMDEKVIGVQAGPLLKDLSGKDRISGQADVKVRLEARGKTINAMRKQLSGNARVSFVDGAIKGVNLARLIRSAESALKGQPLAGTGENEKTDFSELQASADIRDGVIYNDDLVARSPYVRVKGKGKASLATESLDYLLTTTLVSSPQGQGVDLGKLKGIAIPVRIGGTFEKPTYTPDIAAAIVETKKAEIKEKVDEKKDELKEKLNKKLNKKLGDGLGKELGGALEGLLK